jgi:hypothetical protein
VAAAVARDPVGVDVESVALNNSLAMCDTSVLTSTEISLIRRLPEPAELSFLRIWVAKETLAKLGLCSLYTFRNVDVSGLLCSDNGRLNTLGVTVRVWLDDIRNAVVGVGMGPQWRLFGLAGSGLSLTPVDIRQ